MKGKAQCMECMSVVNTIKSHLFPTNKPNSRKTLLLSTNINVNKISSFTFF